MKTSVFDPLGMKNSYAEDKYNRIVPNNATSYNSSSADFEREVEYWGYVGSGNVHSTTNDLLKWLSNFYVPQEGWESAFKMLETLDPFNNGRPNNYAFGVVIDESNGKKRIQHGGAVGGFRSYACTYPEEKLNIVVLSNFSSSSPGQKVAEISKLFLKETDSNITLKSKLPDVISYNVEGLKKFEGQFWNNKENYVRKIYVKNDTLTYQRTATNESKLLPIGDSKFKMIDVEVNLVVDFVFNQNQLDKIEVTINEDTPIIMQAFEEFKPSSDDKKSFVGTYYSPELETQYKFYIENDQLMWRHIRHGEFPVEIIGKNILQMTPRVFINVKRNSIGKIEGFYVSNGRVKNLWFKKEN
jgi:hypothetical protein